MIKRRKAARPPHHYAIAGVLALVSLWLFFMLTGLFQKEETARQAAAEARRELDALAKREATLKQNLEDLATERGQEASIRETYGVARPGEEVIIVVEPPPEKPLQELPWWNKVLGWFGL
jgi:cell division protein FtsB